MAEQPQLVRMIDEVEEDGCGGIYFRAQIKGRWGSVAIPARLERQIIEEAKRREDTSG